MGNMNETSTGTVFCVHSFDGCPFTITIDRKQMQRRYQLRVFTGYMGSYKVGKPMTRIDFETKFGFTVEWPHIVVRKTPDKRCVLDVR